jgi:hypothetical protein
MANTGHPRLYLPHLLGNLGDDFCIVIVLKLVEDGFEIFVYNHAVLSGSQLTGLTV